MEHEILNKQESVNSNLGVVNERLKIMQLHEEWFGGISEGNQAQFTSCRTPNGWIYTYSTGNGQLTSTFVPFDTTPHPINDSFNLK